MEGKYRVTFDDGSVEELTAADATKAKNAARTKRILALDPAGNMNKADLMSHGSVKIRQVVEVAVAIFAIICVHALYAAVVTATGGHATDAHYVLQAGVLDLMAFTGTAINTTITAIAAVTGDSAMVPSFVEGKKAWLMQVWCDFQAAGTFRIHSGKMHDNSSGIRYDIIASDLYPLLPWGAKQPLYTGDTINVDAAGSATAGDIEYVLLLRYFEELSAQHANMITGTEALQKAGNLHMVENTIATGATAAWAGAEAINAEIDQFHARSRYALLGYVVDTECPAVAWKGFDTANQRVGGPGIETDREVTQDWFLQLSRMYSLPLVPVFNADNRAATTIEALQDENGADTTVISIYAELAA